MLDAQQDGDAVTFKVRVVPRASRTDVVGLHGNAIKVALCAPPVEGKANAALVVFLAKTLGVPRRAVTLVRGERGRDKVLRADGVCAADVRALVKP